MTNSCLRMLAAVAVCGVLTQTTSSYGQPATHPAVTATINVDVDKPGTAMPPMFYGLMTEEINHSYDGGLYAELIQNRTFHDDKNQPAHWSPLGEAKIHLDRTDPVNSANPVCLTVDLNSKTVSGVQNDGFWGIPVMVDAQYAVSFYAKGAGGFNGAVTAAIVGSDGTEYAKATSDAVTAGWKKYELTFKTPANIRTTKDAKFILSAKGEGSVSFNAVSLFPPTYMDAPHGLRTDLMKLMAGLKPAFIRLPGGNYLEGNTFPTRYQWKQQIGPVDGRPGHGGCWGYRSSDGMGLPQMLLWCQQLNAEPVLGVFAGYTLNHDHAALGPDMQPFVDEALEEIEYVSGDPNSTWGKQRAADGFTQPFKLTYVEIGNEDWIDRSHSYDGRFSQMYDAIKAKFPNLKLIATGPVTSRTPDLYDDHFYQSPNAMVADSNHYDKPKGISPKAVLSYGSGRFSGAFVRGQVPDVFCGEWASQQGRPTANLRAALADSVWLMGLERNSDLVKIECYAPLFANVNDHAWQWGTNLIGYDALSAFGSPSYYAQAMFSQNNCDVLLPAECEIPKYVAPVAQPPHGAVGLGTWHTDVEYKNFEVKGPDGQILVASDAASDAKNWRFTSGGWITQDGGLKSTEARMESLGTIGDPKWTDYTLTVKARKIGGDEGFLVLWHAADDQTYNTWNVGGWNNSRTQPMIAREGRRAAYGTESRFQAETGKWYDLRLEVHGDKVRCFIDNTLVNEATDPPAPIPPQPLYVAAGYVTASDEVVLKVVNYSGEPIQTTLNLRGAANVKPKAKMTVLSGLPDDVNTVTEPKKIAPVDDTLSDAAATMQRNFPPYSLTLMRIATTAN